MSDSQNVTAVPAQHAFRRRGFSTEAWIKSFFGANAAVTIIILILIILFLGKEGIGFFPSYREELAVYRQAGLEYVDLSRKDLTAHEQMVSLLNRSYYAEINSKTRTETNRSMEASALVTYVTESTTAARSAMARVKESSGEQGEIPAELKASLDQKYQEQLSRAISGKAGQGFPATPHLSASERSEILSQLKARDPLSQDDPEFVANLAATLAAKKAEIAATLTDFRATIDQFSDASMDLSNLISEVGDTVKATKDAATLHEEEVNKQETLNEAAKKESDPAKKAALDAEAKASITTQAPDYAASIEPVLARQGEFESANQKLVEAVTAISKVLPQKLSDDKATRYLDVFRKGIPAFNAELADTVPALRAWKWNEPISLWAAIRGFITGRDWITGGDWQDFYGILPLFTGSLIISIIALTLAIPLGVSAAIYTNQFAGPRQQRFIKPCIEFLQAIPSVVLGFLGIAVLGTFLFDISQHEAFSMIPGFPIQQRLNMFTAGCLLGLMAIPTIFSLAEDAINNVPSAYAEASDALGASKIQTVFRVTVPAAISGIVAAVLLGFGRVIGETMVVLLVAGNRIQIPDFTDGIGVMFQPAHTLTGIIAQELGEVPFGSVHYRALFVVGILLFAIVLVINWISQRLMQKLRH
jgi:phosphate transport system permease protein